MLVYQTVLLFYQQSCCLCSAMQLLAALEPVKPLVTWPPSAFSTLPHDLRTGVPAAIANCIVTADDHITQLQRARAALQQQAGVRQGVVRHYSLRQQQAGDGSSGSVVNRVLQVADAAVAWLQEDEQQRQMQRVQQAQVLQQQRQTEAQQGLATAGRGMPNRIGQQQQQQQQVLPGVGSRAESAGVNDDAAAAASSLVQLQVCGQSAEAESVLTQQLVDAIADSAMRQQHVASEAYGEEDLAAVREKMRQLEAELAVLQQREAQLAAGSALSALERAACGR
jgi:flavin-binding protein dodecin